MRYLKHLVPCLTAVLALSACGDIMDTLDEYKGDGEIRYVGQASDLTVKPGWQRLIVAWKNSEDPIIQHVKVKWVSDNAADSVLLDKGATSYSIGGLGNESYAVSVTEVSGSGKESLTNTLYERPYTDSHEAVESFTRIVSNHFFLGNRLAVKFLGWQDGIDSAVITFTRADGKPDSLVLDEKMVVGKVNDVYKAYYRNCPYYLIPQEIDTTKPVELHRRGKLAGCEDMITFPVYQLENKRTYSSDFKEFLRSKYGTNSEVLDADGEVKDSWADNVTELELDCNLNNFDDLLNLPHLKKLVLGKHRYLTTSGANDRERGQYTVTDTYGALFSIVTLYQVNGLTVDRYNKHYRLIKARRGNFKLTEKGASKIPDYNFYDLKASKVTVTPADDAGYDSHASYLVDGDNATCWQPLQLSSSTDYTITIDLGKEVEADGISFVQKAFADSDNDKDLTPSMIKVSTADGYGVFTSATHVSETYIGTSSGETNIIPFAGTRRVRYVRVRFAANPYHGYFGSTFAELGLYK